MSIFKKNAQPASAVNTAPATENGGDMETDLDEVMRLSDRIMVMFEGEKTGEMSSAEADEKRLGKLMFGKNQEEEEAV